MHQNSLGKFQNGYILDAFCVANGDGNYFNTNECNGGFTCSGGFRTNLVTCSSATYYNTISGVCESSVPANCVGGMCNCKENHYQLCCHHWQS